MFQTQTLSSCLRLLTIPIKEVPSVSALVLVKVGSRYENDKTNGLAHFCEHMLFQGNDKWPTKLDLATTVDSVGAEYNGFTGKEYTGFYVKSESKNLSLAFDILSQMLWHSRFESAQIEREKPVILEEISYRKDTPQIAVFDIVTGMVFSGHPLGFSGVGEKEAVHKFERDNFLKFHKDYYHGSNTIVVIAGRFDEKETKNMVSTYLEQVPKGVAVEPSLFRHSGLSRIDSEAARPASRNSLPEMTNVVVKEKSTDQTHFCLGMLSFKKTDPRRYALSLLNIILGSGMSSRLFQKIREEKSMAYYIDSDVESYSDCGIFTVSAGVNPKRLSEALETVIAELNKITKSGAIKKEELRKAKDYLRGKLALGLEESLEQAMFYGMSWLLEDKIRSVEEILKEVEKVTADEVISAARDLFKIENFKLGVVGKDAKKGKIERVLS